MSESSMSESPVCTNCGDPRVDVYCAKCGERQPHHHELTVGHFAHDVVHEVVHLDSKLFRTLKVLIAKPGQLTVEYFSGQKQRSIGPLRMFLTLFALQFLAYTAYKPASMYSIETFSKFDRSGALQRLVDKRATRFGLTRAQYEEKLDDRWHKNLSLLQFVNVLGVALVLKLLYLRRRRFMVEHLVFAAHYLCFSYIYTLLVWPIYALAGFSPGPLQRVITVIHVLINLVYVYYAQRRFYQLSKGKTVAKTVLLWIGVWAVSVFILTSALVAALVQTH